MPAEPPESDAPTIQYMRMDIVQAMVGQAAGGDEFFIQILFDDRTLMGLTNYGRIFQHQPDALAWIEIPGPEIEP